MPLRPLLCLVAAATITANAQWHAAGSVDSVRTDGKRQVTLFAGSSTLTLTAMADDMIRVLFRPAPSQAPDRSWAVVKPEWPAPEVTLRDGDSTLTMATSRVTVVVGKHPLRISFRNASGEIINQDAPSRGMSWHGNEVRVWKTMPQEERYYGFGEKTGRFQRRDHGMTMWNSDIPGYDAGTDPLYQTIPFFYGIRNGRAYGIFFDNTYRSFFDMGKGSRSEYSFGAEGGALNYYFFAGPTPSSILSRFTELVGRMPLPPLWSLGYQQCRFSYTPESRVREIARGFRSRRMPCDVLYLDIDYMDGYRVFTWNPATFPDPPGLVRDLRAEGFRTVVIVDPGVKLVSAYTVFRSGLAADAFLHYPNGALYTGKVWPGMCVFPDFTSASVRRWWGDQYAGFAAAGISGWWNDMNEPSVFDVPTNTVDLSVVHDGEGIRGSHAEFHNVYGMQMTRGTYEGARRFIPGSRPFVLTRASYAGGWRYAAAWTGDNMASWDHLAMSLSMCLNLSISGQPFVGSDIGGFVGYPSGELFARWLQLGVFTPLMRAHSVIHEKNKEPWEYGDQYTTINRGTLDLRYEFLPYVYTTMATASRSGIPAMRPMIFEYPEDRRFTSTDEEFLFGPDLLVAPVLTEGARRKSVDIPAGVWYDYWSGARLQGNQRVDVEAPLERIPLFVRAGAVIPLRQAVQYTAEAPVNPLTLMVFPPDSGTTMSSPYYEDDGESFAYEGGAFFERSHRVRSEGSGEVLTITKAEGSYVPPSRKVLVCFAGLSGKPRSVSVNGKKTSQWTYDDAKRIATVVLPDSRDEMEVALVL